MDAPLRNILDQLKALLRSDAGLEMELLVSKIDMLEDPACVTLLGAGGSAPPFRVGDAVDIEFPRAVGAGNESAAARLVFEGRDADRHRYLVTLPRVAATHLARHLNRRSALRVPPALTAPVRIEIRHPRLEEPARLDAREISTGGVGLGVPAALEERLVGTWDLDLAVRLPGGSEAFEVTGEVRYRRLTGTIVFYGLRFHVPSTELRLRFERELFAYVMLRQRELSR